MAKQRTPGSLYGRGAILDVDNNLLYKDFAGTELTSPLEVLEIPRGQMAQSKKRVMLGQDFLANLSFHTVSADLLAVLLGGTVATAANEPEWYEEAQTVPADPYQITLTGTPYATGAVYVEDESGVGYKQVTSGQEVAGESYSIAAAVLTFALGDEGKKMTALYFKQGSGGVKVTVAPNDLPTGFKLLAALRLKGDTETPKWFTAEFAKVERNGEIGGLGAGENAHGPVTVPVAALNDHEGDVVFYFPESF